MYLISRNSYLISIIQIQLCGVLMGFVCSTQIVSGSARQALGNLGAKRMMEEADPFFKDGIARELGAAAEQAEYFFDVVPDPTTQLAARGAAAVKAFGPEVVVALGGGSAMDLAKSMVWFSGVEAKLVAIPTTSGSGSEVTDFAILTHDQVKHPLVDPKLRPHMAILDVQLVAKLPKSLVAEGGFDAMTHALEAYTAANANRFTDALATAAFSQILNSLEASFRGNLQARGGIHEAATMAGLSFTQSGLGLCHAMAHALGGLLHLPHGRLNAILLPAVMEVNGPACAARYAQLARAAGLEGRSDTMAVRSLRNALVSLRKSLGLPSTLPEAQVAPHRLKIIEAALADPCCETNPMPVTAQTVDRVLRMITGHG